MKNLLLSLVMLSAGCVSSGRYDAALAELETCKQDAASQKADLEKAKAELQANLDHVNAQLKESTSQLESLGVEKGNLASAMEKLQAEDLGAAPAGGGRAGAHGALPGPDCETQGHD